MEPQQTPNFIPQSPDITNPEMVAPIVPVQTTVLNQIITNKIWSKDIKLLNRSTLAIAMGLILLVDLPILIQSPELASFFYFMIAALILLTGCLLFESWAGRQLQDSPQSRLDSIILQLARLRNAIIILNVIPLIQLIGFLAIPFALLFIIANAIMITIRLKQVTAPTLSSYQ